MSLICSSLTWLRNHKATKYEASLQVNDDSYQDEPQWVIDQLLRRKRDELVRKWEDREKRLENARRKEKALEERGRKRRRIEDGATTRRNPEDEDAEWLLDDWDGRGSDNQDSLSGLSKETRETLTRIGLGGFKKEEDEQDMLGEEVKVRTLSFSIGAARSDMNRSTTLQELTRNCPNLLPSFVVRASRLLYPRPSLKQVPL